MGKHLIGCEDMAISDINQILNKAEEYQKANINLQHKEYNNKFIANLFLEPSTRTRFSFEVAEKKLGLHVLNFQSENSSIQKGETLFDTIRTLESLGVEAVVIRTEIEVMNELAKINSIKIINAGEGQKEHPTQALLDLYTIKKYFNNLKGLNVAIIGDIAHSRVAKSNSYLLKKFGANLMYSGPQNLMDFNLDGKYLSIDEAIRQSDVVMMLRIQFERMKKNIISSKEEYNQLYGLTEKRLNMLQAHTIILHPSPVNRGIEIDDIAVEHPKSKIFEQIEHGVFIRMATIDRALKG